MTTYEEQMMTIFGGKMPVKVLSPRDHIVRFNDGTERALTDSELTQFAKTYLSGLYSLGDIPYRLQNIIQNHDAMKKERTAALVNRFSKLDWLTTEDFDLLIKHRIELGDVTLPQRVNAIKTEIEAENAEAEAERKVKDAQAAKEEAERQKFPSVFKRLVPHIEIKSYLAEIEQRAETATIEELTAMENWLLHRTEGLKETSKALGLATLQKYLRIKTQAPKLPKTLTPLEKARSIFNLTRGH